MYVGHSVIPCKNGTFPSPEIPRKGALSTEADVAMLALLFGRARECPGGVEKPIELTADGVWNEISGRLREALNENTFSTWFAEVEAVGITDGEFGLSVPNDFTREWIEGHFLGLIEAALAEVAGDRSVRLRIAEHAAKPEAAQPKVSEQTAQPGLSINAKYTFDSFVIGSSNRFAHAA